MSLIEKTKELKEYDQNKKLEFLLQNLQELQFKINKGAQHYIPEMQIIIKEFKEQFQKVQDNPASKNERYIEICIFMQGVAHHYQNSFQFFPKYLIDILENYAEQLNPKILQKTVICLIGLRNKNMIQPLDSLSSMFKLFRIQNKELRKIVNSHIINDIKRQNKKHTNPSFNKKVKNLQYQVQNMISEIIKNNSDNLAKRSLQIAIQLYKSQVWMDPKLINIISSACFSSYYKLILISCFFLIQTTEVKFVDSESEEEDFKTLCETRGSKKTRSKQARLDKEKKKHEKKLRKKGKVDQNKTFFPIDQIYNPQDFCEKLFAQLKKFSGKFEVKLAMISVISRMVGRHNLLLLNFYSFMLKYLNPHQRDIGKLLAYMAESIHDQLQVEELEPIIKHLIDQFIGEHVSDDKIVMGINTVREIVFKKHQLLDAEKLNFICEFSDYREKNVNQSAKSIINYYRDVNPKLLHKKFRGRMDQMKNDDNNEVQIERIATEIRGAELLKQDGEYPVYMERVLDDQDFKRIKYLQKKKYQEEEEKRQNELQRLREVRSGINKDQEMEDEGESGDEEDNQEDGSDCSEISDFEEMSGDEYEEISGDELEEEEEDQDQDQEQKIQKKTAKKTVLKKRKNFTEDSMSSMSESEDNNPHGFITEGQITNFKKTKAQQKKETLEKKQVETKEKAFHGPKQKGGGSTNKEKLKNKNLIMLRPKKNKAKIKTKQVNATLNRIKCIKNQLGHVRSGKEASRRKKVKL